MFTVFDGHAGKSYADQVAVEFVDFLILQAPFDKLKDEDPYDAEQITNALRQAFLDYDKKASHEESYQHIRAENAGW